MAGSSRIRSNSTLKVWLLSKFESSDMFILAHDMLIPGSDPTGKVNSTGSVDMTSTPISIQIEGQVHAVIVSPSKNRSKCTKVDRVKAVPCNKIA